MHRQVRGKIAQPAGSYPAGTPYRADQPDLLLWVLFTLVDSAVAALVAAGAGSARGRVLRGLPGEEAQAILDVARKEDADIIVVGPRGMGRLAGLLVGSVTNRLVQLSDRPVLVVR